MGELDPELAPELALKLAPELAPELVIELVPELAPELDPELVIELVIELVPELVLNLHMLCFQKFIKFGFSHSYSYSDPTILVLKSQVKNAEIFKSNTLDLINSLGGAV